MPANSEHRSFRTFTFVWFGQLISMIGSSMTWFAVSIWVWQLTGRATDLALFGFFSQLPQIFMYLISGTVVDRASRKLLMIVGDLITGVLTIILAVLYLSGHIQIWHLYMTVAIAGIFEQFQALAFEASISTLVDRKDYTRATSMGFFAEFASYGLGPALAGVLYLTIGLGGIMAIDIATFLIAISIVVSVHIPQPARSHSVFEGDARTDAAQPFNILKELSFGWRYLTRHRGLMILLVWTSLFWFAHDLGQSVYSAMVLARSNSDPRILGSLTAASGIAGVLSAAVMGKFGGFKRQVNGIRLGMLGVGLSKIVFGLGRVPLIWIPAEFACCLNLPILGSSTDTIWLNRVSPELQGRVFATSAMVMKMISSLGYLASGPLADRFFEPAMMPGGLLAPMLGGVFGTEKGSGIALLFVICAISMFSIGVVGYRSPQLQRL
ncbi:MAG: MFS transporter [Leptolyngbya sp. SIO4C5]|nr:MFS transporter [Leptolyngbya sp. SIO4C5]